MITLDLNKADIRKLERRIERLASLDRIARKEIVKAARSSANMYVKAARSNIKDYGTTIRVRRKSGPDYDIPPGTLRRSVGIWVPKGAKTQVAAGPRASTLGKRLAINRDGWFAHFVEAGTFPAAFGGKQTTANTGVFNRTKRNTGPAIRRTMTGDMQKIILKYSR